MNYLGGLDDTKIIRKNTKYLNEKYKSIFHKTKQNFNNLDNKIKRIIFISSYIFIFAIVGTIALFVTRADSPSPYISLSADNGTITTPAAKQNCAGATGGYCVVFNSSSSNGPTYYVSPAGSSSVNNSTSTSPMSYATFNSELNSGGSSCPTPGSSILFEGDQTYSSDLEPNCSGNATFPITYGAYGSGNPNFTDVWFAPTAAVHNLVFNGLNLSPDNGITGATCNNASNTIPFSASDGSATPADPDPVYDITLENSLLGCTPTLGVHIAPTDYSWTIENNTIQYTGDSGILVEYTQPNANITISGNTIDNTGQNQANISYDTHGIYAKGPDLTISYNNISNDDGTGQAISIRDPGDLIFGNLIHDTADALGFFDYDQNTGSTSSNSCAQGTSYIYSNRLWNISANDFYYDGSDDAQTSTAVVPSVCFVIASNTFVNDNSSSQMFNLSEVPSTASITTLNNIFTGNYDDGYLGCPSGTICTENYDDWYGASADIPSAPNDIDKNPELSAQPNFVPTTGSPVIAAGTTSVPGLIYTQSSSGQPLDYIGSSPDMGAE